MKHAIYLSYAILLFCSSVSHGSTHQDITPPPGWPQKVAMGSVINGGSETAQFIQRPVYAAFTYAGNDGGGDPGKLIAHDDKVERIITQIRQIEAQTKPKIAMMPVFVFYTVDGSSGTDSILRDMKQEYMVPHFRNLISLLQQLEKYKDTDHPYPASIILNPDFLGEMHKQCTQYYCPVPLDMSLPVKQSLLEALKEAHYSGKVPDFLLEEKQSFPGYIAAINWMMHEFGPHITFGWQLNVWAGDQKGHMWLHQATSQPQLIDEHADAAVKFINDFGVYDQDARHLPYRPHFLAVDKYERDTFTCDTGNCTTYSQNGYLYNGRDMNVYLNFIQKVGQKLGPLPVMLWQIPGGHTQTGSHEDPDQRANHASTEASYLLGDPQLVDNAFLPYYANLSLPSAIYNTDKKTVAEYLALCPAGDDHCLQHDHMSQVKSANIFAILWGGGSTTGVSGLSPALDDNGWLYSRIQAVTAAGDEDAENRLLALNHRSAKSHRHSTVGAMRGHRH